MYDINVLRNGRYGMKWGTIAVFYIHIYSNAYMRGDTDARGMLMDMSEKKSKNYIYKNYKVKVNYLDEKSLSDYLNESIETTFIPKILEEVSKKKIVRSLY